MHLLSPLDGCMSCDYSESSLFSISPLALEMQKIFVDNALRHLGYENTELHIHSTQLNILMFEFAIPPFFKSGTKD